jgi:hypothetical protein
MKLAIMQPYFMPYIGYFQLIKAVDKYIFYDDVNYIKGGWINRNYILINGERKFFTIALKNASPNKLINEIEICDDFHKFIKTIQFNYKKAPYFNEIYLLLDNIISNKNRNLSDFIINSYKVVFNYLKINKTLLISSKIPKNCSLKGKHKVIEICKISNASTYINPIGGKGLYSKNEFDNEGIKLNFLQTNNIEYEQFGNKFIPWLSIIDVLMFNSPEKIVNMLDAYELI